MLPRPLCNTGNVDLCSLDSRVKHFLHSEGNIATHAVLNVAPQLFQNKQKCSEEQREEGGLRRVCMQRDQGSCRQEDLSESWFLQIAVLTALVCVSHLVLMYVKRHLKHTVNFCSLFRFLQKKIWATWKKYGPILFPQRKASSITMTIATS